MAFIRWLTSGTVRKAVQLRNSIRRILREQEDLLAAESFAEINSANEELTRAINSGATASELTTLMRKVENVAIQRFKPYPFAAVRENIKEFLVAVVVIFGFTTFFLQLTKIPTGSMQPTLFGITHAHLAESETIPNAAVRFWRYWTKGLKYLHLKAKVDGELQAIEDLRTIVPFVKRQRLLIGGVWHTLMFVPDDLRQRLEVMPGHRYKAGEDVVKMVVKAGDHLLIDRFTYNFRRPKRGEIIVFKTRGISALAQQDQLYIKRLIALGGETVSIGDDSHVVVNGDRLDASDRHFEQVYGYDGQTNAPYIGHANGLNSGDPRLASYFPNAKAEFKLPPDHYLAMGDNTLHSFDSRGWGSFPEKNVIGRAFFVYWPITDRFGWGYR